MRAITIYFKKSLLQKARNSIFLNSKMPLINKERAFSVMDRYNLDAIIATTPANVTYTTDYRAVSHEHLGSFVFSVFARDKGIEPILILPTAEFSDLEALGMTWVSDVRTYGTFFVTLPESAELSKYEKAIASRFRAKSDSDPFLVLKNALSEKNLIGKKIGVDEKGFKGDDFQKFLKAIGSEKVSNAYEIFREIRQVKNSEEIAAMRKGIEITEKGIKAAIESIHVGASGIDLVRAFGDTVADLGVYSYTPSISLGKDSYLQYNYKPSNKKLEQGDLIRFDVSCLYDHHYTDIGRNVVLGKASTRQKECYKVVLEGESGAISKLQEGAKASEVFVAGVDAAQRAGMPNFQRSHCGHGIGLELYEYPLITRASENIIENGSVLNIETPYYEIANGGYMVEDTLLVTKRGVEFLTKLDRSLIEV